MPRTSRAHLTPISCYVCARYTHAALGKTELFTKKGWKIGKADNKRRMIWYIIPETMTTPMNEVWAEVVAEQCVEQMHAAGMRSVAFDRLGCITRPGTIEVIFTHESALHVTFPGRSAGKCGTGARSTRTTRTTSPD